MDLIVTDPSGTPIACHDDYTLDLAYGSDENDFELTLPSGATRLRTGSLIWVDGTGIGGIVDQTVDSVTGGVGTIAYKGRDWHGILDSRILEPDTGRDYLTVSGTIPDIIGTLLTRTGLTGLFKADRSSTASVASWQFDRYCSLYEGLCKLLRAQGLRLDLTATDDGITVGVKPVVTLGDTVDSDVIDFDVTDTGRPVNHLICLGKGELRDRAVVHLYADANGTVSHTKTLTGIKERSATYEYSNAERAELEAKGREKLQDLQRLSTVSVDIRDGLDADVGDIVTGRDNSTGLTVTAEITKKTVKVSKGVATVTVEAGNTGLGSMSGTAETSGSSGGGGHAYQAGAGLTLSNWTFSADVTQAKLDAVAKTADTANRTASNLSADIAQAVRTAQTADGKADTAQTTADTAKTTADMALDAAGKAVTGITATAPVKATRTGATVTLSAPGTLPAPTQLGSTASLDDLKTSWGAWYAIGGNRVAGKPAGVQHFGVVNVRAASGWTVQLLVDPYAGRVWRRTWDSAKWTAWTAFADAVVASTVESGLMSATDKAKLDTVAANANAYTLPAATTTALGGVKPDGRTIHVSADGVISAQVDDAGASFLAAHPVDSLYWTTSASNPAADYGGSWTELDTMLGGHVWQRKA